MSIVARPGSSPIVDWDLECGICLPGEERPSKSTILCEAYNGGSGNNAKSAALACEDPRFGKKLSSGDAWKDEVAGDSALDIGEQCEDGWSNGLLEKSRPIADKSTKADGGKSGKVKDVGRTSGADPGGDGILEAPVYTDRSTRAS